MTPHSDMKNFIDVSDGHGISCYAERSKSGSGYHVYAFFKEPVPAWKARAVFFDLLKDAQVINSELCEDKVTLSSFDRLFPNQDSLSGLKPLGNLIALPLQGESVESGNTVFLDPNTGFTEPYADQVVALRAVIKVTEAELDALIVEWGIIRPVAPTQALAVAGGHDDQLTQLLSCDFLRWAYENQADVKEPLWYAMLSNVSRIPSGGIRLCHEFSKNYPKYSYSETEKKICQAIDGSLPQNCAHIRSQGFNCTKNCGVKSPVGLLYRRANIAVSVETSSTSSQNVLIRDYLPDLPTTSNLILPQGYSYENGMLITRIEKGKELRTEIVANEPVFITGMLKEVGTNNESVEIAAYHNKTWIMQIVPRGVIANQKEIISLANTGYPVTSTNAKMLVDYLHNFEHANRSILPIQFVTKTLGWQPDLTSFVWGDTTITDVSTVANQIKFKGVDDGYEKLGRGLYQSGSYEAWVKAANMLLDYPRAAGVLYFSLMAPFLEVLGIGNFTVDLAGETSTGKTTVLRCAASCWGNPDGGSEGRMVHPWENTSTWLERVASLFRGIPLILDDTRPVQKKEEIGQFIYLFCNGEGKGRGTKQGLQSTGAIRSILLSSGEANLTQYTQGKGGVYGRLISLWGPPFGSGNKGDLVVELNKTVRENFGHAGPKIIEFIIRERESWNLWKEACAEYRTYFNGKANGNKLAGRLGEYFAGLSTVIALIHAALPELRRDKPLSDLIEELWVSAYPNERDIDTCTQSLEILYGWAVKFKNQFYDIKSQYTENLIYSGRWDKNGDFVSFDRETARKILADAGFEPDAIFKTMKDRGWLFCDKTIIRG